MRCPVRRGCQRARLAGFGHLGLLTQSLAAVDQILGDFHDQQAVLPDELVFDVAAYVFEVGRREFGGRFAYRDDENPVVLVVGQPEYSVGLCAMSKVRDRVSNGPEDDIPFFYDGLVDRVKRRESATIV